jgi:hypothetical protein
VPTVVTWSTGGVVTASETNVRSCSTPSRNVTLYVFVFTPFCPAVVTALTPASTAGSFTVVAWNGTGSSTVTVFVSMTGVGLGVGIGDVAILSADTLAESGCATTLPITALLAMSTTAATPTAHPVFAALQRPC